MGEFRDEPGSDRRHGRRRGTISSFGLGAALRCTRRTICQHESADSSLRAGQHRFVRSLALIALVASSSGCGEDTDFHCEAPATVEYSCEPISSDQYGCIGGPTWRSNYSGPEHREDPNKVFPVHCTARLPECGCCYTSGRLFVCSGDYPEPNDAGIDGPLGPAGWGELL